MTELVRITMDLISGERVNHTTRYADELTAGVELDDIHDRLLVMHGDAVLSDMFHPTADGYITQIGDKMVELYLREAD